MPRLMVELSREEFERLRDRALWELRHPRHTARLLIREALDLPTREPRLRPDTRSTGVDAHDPEGTARVSA
jgi:hypothetical protein